MKRLSYRLIYIALLIIMTGCISRKDTDQSFLTQSPCKSPCWYGIILDKSTKQEILDTLRTLPFVKATSIKESDVSYQYSKDSLSINYDCNYEVDASWCGNLLIVDGKLKLNRYSFGYELSIKTVTDNYGPPGLVQYISPTSEVGGCHIVFIWPEQEFDIGYSNMKDTKLCDTLKLSGKMNPDQKLSYIEFPSRDILEQPQKGWIVTSWPGYSDNR